MDKGSAAALFVGLMLAAVVVFALLFGGQDEGADAAIAEQVSPPVAIVYNVGAVLVLRIRDEERKADCYVLQRVTGETESISCLRDSWVYYAGGIGSVEALKGWVYFP